MVSWVFDGNMVEKWTNEPCNGLDEVVNLFWVLTISLVHVSHLVQVVFYIFIVVKISSINSCSTWEIPRNQIYFIPGLLGALLLFSALFPSFSVF